MKKRLFAVLLGIAVLLPSSNLTTVMASKNNSIQLNDCIDEKQQDHYCSVDPLYLLCTDEENREYSHGSIIHKQFEIKSSLDVDTYEIVLSSYDGVEIIKEPTYTTNNNGVPVVEIDFKVLDSCEIGNICFTIRPSTSTSDDVAAQICSEQNIYCYHDVDYDYVSTIYLDCLSSYSEKLQKHLLDVNRQGESIERIRSTPETIKGSDGITRYSYSVAGYISWTDGNGGVHAADNIKVELCDASSGSGITSTYTTSSGGYSLSYSTTLVNPNVKIKVYSEGSNITLINTNSPYGQYIYESSPFTMTGFTKVSYTAPNSTNLGQSLSIQQAMALAHQYVLNLDSTNLNSINVYFPNSSSNSYFTTPPAIYIKQGHEFEWDTLEHEYGHYVQYHYSISNSPGGIHYLSDNLADARNNKSAGIRLAWGEGWATYFAINLQNEMNASYLYIPHVGDSHYQDSSNGIDYDLESPAIYYLKGEANEVVVSAVLYDMTDGVSSLDNDQVSFTDSFVWNLIKNNYCTTLSDFIQSFYLSSTSPANKYNLGSTLSKHKIAAEPSTPSSATPPTFSWAPQGGSNLFPNNYFRVVFLNSNYTPLLSTSYTSSNSITLTSSQWSLIQSSLPVYYYIETNQTEPSAPTGPYYSVLKSLP